MIGSQQPWTFEPPHPGWLPPTMSHTSLYVHVPFCRHDCPYCPYTKVPYEPGLIEPYVQSAIAEIDWWAAHTAAPQLTSIYVGGGTPTLALPGVRRILDHARRRFQLSGDICIEANPSDVSPEVVRQLRDGGVGQVSLGVQSFGARNLELLGRGYQPRAAQQALGLLAAAGFSGVNVDLMFALPGGRTEEILSDLEQAVALGATQITAYPLFTFPFAAVGLQRRLSAVHMPGLRSRRRQYRAIHSWCGAHGFARTSVWGFTKQGSPRYSSVTRDGYIGIGPGAGSHLGIGFAFNTFDLDRWARASLSGGGATALWLPFTPSLAGWWWLYWRLYDTKVPLAELARVFAGPDRRRARLLLALLCRLGLATQRNGACELTEPGAFWVHLAQNHFALDYVNRVWTEARHHPSPERVTI